MNETNRTSLNVGGVVGAAVLALSMLLRGCDVPQPPTPPDPIPVPPGPVDPDPPDPAPLPGDGLRVLILYESDGSDPMPAKQVMIFTSRPLVEWLQAHNANWRIWDVHVDATQEEDANWQGAIASANAPRLPWLIVQNGTKHYAGDLPETADALLSLLKGYVTEEVTPPEAANTPIEEVRRVLGILRPQANETFVDYGCGADARWCIEAARVYGCRAVGVEIDPGRAAKARQAVATAGLAHRVEIIEADATQANVAADVGVAFLYPDTLVAMKPKLEKLKRFASYMHQVPGMQMVANGDSYFYTKPEPVANWQGYHYRGRMCNNPNCEMCNSIQWQLDHADD